MAKADRSTRSSSLVTAHVRVFIPRSPEIVFTYFVDLRNEPEYNSQVREIVKTSPDPIGRDATFVGVHRGLGRVAWRLVEYDAPKHVTIEGVVGKGTYRWVSDFEPAGDGTWLIGRMEWEPPRAWRRFRSILGPILAWNASRSFRRLAAVLEHRVLPDS